MNRNSHANTAFQQLYEFYRNDMLKWAHHFFHCDADCEDAVEDAFLKIGKRIQMIQKIESPETKRLCWIVLKNVSLNMLKKQQREIPTDPDEMISAGQEMAALADAWQAGGEQYEALHRAIDRLDKRETEILWLYYKYQFTAKEIGKQYGIKPGTVNRILSRARQRIKTYLLKEQQDEQ